MHRYIDVSDFRAPYDSPELDLAGLMAPGSMNVAYGAPMDPRLAAHGHHYLEMNNFRAPYDHRGYFQDNNLFGLGIPFMEPLPDPNPIKNPYTVGAAILGGFVGLVVGFVAARIMR